MTPPSNCGLRVRARFIKDKTRRREMFVHFKNYIHQPKNAAQMCGFIKDKTRRREMFVHFKNYIHQPKNAAQMCGDVRQCSATH